MKNKRKLRFRIWVLFSIVLFLLLPLLSSPVAAAFTFNVSTAWTNNTAAGPTVGWTNTGGNPPGAYTSVHTNPASATFVCNFSFADTSGQPQTPCSRHYGELNVQKIFPTIGPLLTANTGNVFLSNTGTFTTTLSIGDTYTPNPPMGVTWNISVYVECEDLPSSTMAWNTWYWNYTVV
jgi:hypothetical protein